MAASVQIHICSPMTREEGAHLVALYSIGPKGRDEEAVALPNALLGGQSAFGLPI